MKKKRSRPTRSTHYDNVARFIDDYWREYYRSPTMREVAGHIESSTSIATYTVDLLVRDGLLLDRGYDVARNLIPPWVAEAIDAYHREPAL